MFILGRTLFWLLSFFIGLDLIHASSAPPRPLKRIAHPNTLTLEILPRRPSASGSFGKRSYPINSSVLQHTDTFRLRLSAFGDTFHLHLRPNEHLIHPAARINHYTLGPNGQSVLSYSEPIVPGAVKAYWGEVIPAQLSADRMREDAAGVYPRPSGKSELGWARIVVHHQGDVTKGTPPSFEGAFSVNGVVHHVMTNDNYFRHKHDLDPYSIVEDDPDSALVIFRDSDLMTENEFRDALKSFDGAIVPPPRGAKTCAHDNLAYNTDPRLNPVLRKPPPVTPWYDPLGQSKRDDVMGGGSGSNFQNNIGQSTGCPTNQKVVYMGVAADCVYTSQYGSAQNATQQIITNFNTASALYKSTFNVSLGIIELQVHDPECPSTADPATPWNVACQDNITLNDRLSLFSDWRGKKGNDNAGLWHLMSGCPTGTEVGIAWLGTLCQQTSSGSSPNVVSGTAVSTSGRVEWQVIAHEIGHNFGAIHDCADGCGSGGPTCCPLSASTCNANSQFIMSPVAESSEQKFSQCTLGNICSLMQTGASGATNTTCLIDATNAKDTISLGMCGNGIVESGEECDPGKGVNSTCCDSTTCKLKSGAVCDPDSSACCTQQCSFAPSTQVCRPAKDASCDMVEMCTGNSSACPADITAPNGKSCGGNGLACASGVCTSLDKQCQTVGASMNLQKACPSRNDKSCQVSCQDPTTSNQCIVLQSPLVDGSPCGYGGMCNKGTCQSGSFLDTAKAWYRENLQISIPVTIAAVFVILIILYLIFSAIRSCCRASDRKGYPSRAAGRQRLQSWPNLPPSGYMVQVQPSGPPQYVYGPKYVF
ncbi:Metallo-peptidase family M12-domain-containing protein [Irpex rosettiformis]|uniref:Metallo-peptidase family M12-domain-containing protein n=1 Tax=Irpex rosettiformis TaxID=378272 RepID=A0ACB8U6I8_9APHY|nr:Metallo-peptidase family M12-domain-containing protein [Irpex rosettiformis]